MKKRKLEPVGRTEIEVGTAHLTGIGDLLQYFSSLQRDPNRPIRLALTPNRAGEDANTNNVVLGIKVVFGFGYVEPFNPEEGENEITELDGRIYG